MANIVSTKFTVIKTKVAYDPSSTTTIYLSLVANSLYTVTKQTTVKCITCNQLFQSVFNWLMFSWWPLA